MQTETVKVKREGGRGYHLINKNDFDSNKHQLFDDSIKSKQSEVNKPKTEK